MGKGEIARYEHFQKACFSGVSKGVIEWEWVNHFAQCSLSSLPNDKILVYSALKAFAEEKDWYASKTEAVMEWEENIVGKGENAGYQHFLLFPQCFQKLSLSGTFKLGIVW